jgi:cytochrome P450
VWYLLAGNPDVEAAVIEEALRLVPTVSAVSAETLSEMEYTMQVLEETLRLYPPVWLFTRRSVAEDELEDFDVPVDTDIYFSPFLLHRTEKYWPEPDHFDPDRFAPGRLTKNERPYFPFSLGPRRCLGEYFSFLEMKVHLGLLLPRFRMMLVDDSVPGLELAVNLRSDSDIVLQPQIRTE